jgi:hypothetical protein
MLAVMARYFIGSVQRTGNFCAEGVTADFYAWRKKLGISQIEKKGRREKSKWR